MWKRCASWGVLAAIVAGCGSGSGVENSPVTWKQYPIADRPVSLNTSNGGYIILADFDQSGQPDAASGFESSEAVVLHMQDSVANWTSTVLARNLGEVYSLAADNLRNSGQMDIVAATAGGMRLLLSPSFAGPVSGAWSLSTFDNPAGTTSWNDVKIAQLDEQPEKEIIGTSSAGRVITIWQTSGLVTGASVYTPAVIASDLSSGFQRLAIADIDQDGFLDIVAVGPDSGIVWLQNPGGASIAVPWPVRSIATNLGYTRLVISDLDNDGDPDVAVTEPTGGRVWWFENQGSPRTDAWLTHLLADLSPHEPDAMSVSAPADTKIPDLFVGTSGIDPTIYRLRQYNDPRFLWQVFVVDTPGSAVGELPVGDIGGTGGPDFATTLAGSPTPVVWYQRQ